MNKKLIVSYNKSASGVCNIYIENIEKHSKSFEIVSDIINEFTKSDELFVGAYKIDGINISKAVFKSNERELFEFFSSAKHCVNFFIEGIKNSKHFSDLNAFRIENKKENYSYIRKIFQCTLEAIVFSPQITWNEFLDYFRLYTQRGVDQLVTLGMTEFLISHIDSSDIVVSFDSKKHNTEEILNKIVDIIEGVLRETITN